jgi:D-cysteine desulfhydrase family pyridoxal phosphate-dependent enzyme
VQIDKIERVPLGVFPTPLQPLDGLRERLGGPHLFIKRDDLTGLGLGGNKLRKLEYAFAEARAQGATTIVTVGGPQSNHVRLTTAAASKLGLRTILVLRGEEPTAATGNLLIDRVLGAREIHFVGSAGYPTRGELDRVADDKVAEIVERLTGEGEVPYVIPNGCKAIHGALGYAGCMLELIVQLRARGTAPDAVVTACGTSSTQTGLLLGSHLYAQGEIDVIGISVATKAEPLTDRIDRQLREACAVLELDTKVRREAITVLDAYVGSGYGVPTEEMSEAVLLIARTEGVLLDPVYTGKAMAGMLDLIRRDYFSADDVVVFLHTGGTPGLFADGQIETFQDV